MGVRRITVVLIATIGASGLFQGSPAARGPCRFERGVLTISPRGDDRSVEVRRGSKGEIRYWVGRDPSQAPGPGATCGSPRATVRNTDRIVIGRSERPWYLAVTIDLSGGPFAPGRTSETGLSEIEWRIDIGRPDMAEGIHVSGSAGDDTIVAGERGVALNRDLDADVTLARVPTTSAPAFSAFGGPGDDFLSSEGGFGTGAPATWARSGLTGGLGDDRLTAGPASASLHGNEGADFLRGGVGDDYLMGGEGPDVLLGGAGVDESSYYGYGGEHEGVEVDLASGVSRGGNAEGDTIAEVENLAGTLGSDRLSGDEGPNTINGFSEYDWIAGRGGDDRLDGGGPFPGDYNPRPGDEIDGGEGTDWAIYNGFAGVEINLVTGEHGGASAWMDVLISIENVQGSDYADRLVGDDGDNVLYGWGGNDVIVGNDGDDLEIGGAGDDVFDQGRFPNGGDEFWGDEPYGWATGEDTVDYSDRAGPVFVSRDDQANDGELDEGDFFHDDVDHPEDTRGGFSNRALRLP